MCRSIEEMLEKVTKENTIEFAKRMISLGKNPIEEISECSGLPIEDVRKLASEMKAN